MLLPLHKNYFTLQYLSCLNCFQLVIELIALILRTNWVITASIYTLLTNVAYIPNYGIWFSLLSFLTSTHNLLASLSHFCNKYNGWSILYELTYCFVFFWYLIVTCILIFHSNCLILLIKADLLVAYSMVLKTFLFISFAIL